MTKNADSVRKRCIECGTSLNFYNRSNLCYRCQGKKQEQSWERQEPKLPDFYGYSGYRRLRSSGSYSDEYLVFNQPIRQSQIEKIVAGTVPPNYVGRVRVPKNTEDIWLRPAGSVLVTDFKERKNGCCVRVHNYTCTPVPTEIICRGYWPDIEDYTWD